MSKRCQHVLKKTGLQCKRKQKDNDFCYMHRKGVNSIFLDNNEDKECSICLNIISENEQKLECGHVFHKECISKWFLRSITCPCCRVKVKSDILEYYVAFDIILNCELLTYNFIINFNKNDDVTEEYMEYCILKALYEASWIKPSDIIDVNINELYQI